MKEVLIINLTRMGDLIQTTPTIISLKEQYPDVRITLLVNTAFKEICEYLPHVDRYFHIDKRVVLKMIENNGFIDAYRMVRNVLNRVNDTVYDRVINFTHSRSSAIVTSMIRAKDVRGISIDSKGFTMKRHPWIRYVFNVIPSRYVNPFHLCDMHFKSATRNIPSKKGLHLIVKEEKRKWAEELLRKNGLREGQPLIAFQLGASAEDKRWPVESFARLADILHRKWGSLILLTGSRGEVGFGEEFCRKSNAKTINMMGKTDLTELAALLERADLLVSNDTGPLHVATAVGTKAIDISLASVHFRETGPYGEGHYVISADIPCYPCAFESNCEYLTCKKKITPEAVFNVCELALGKTDRLEPSLFRELQVYRSGFDRDGLMTYRPIIKRKLSLNELFMHLYRYTWQVVLDRKEPTEEADFGDYMDRALSDYEENRDLDETLSEYIEAFSRLQGLVNTLLSVIGVMKRAAQRKEADLEFINKLWENIKPVDKEIEKLGCLYPMIRPIVVMLGYEKESFESSELEDIIKEAEVAYRYALWQAVEIGKMLARLKSSSTHNLTAVGS